MGFSWHGPRSKDIYLFIIMGIPGTAAPSSNADISLAICKSTDELFQVWVILDRVNSDNVASGVNMNTILQRLFELWTSFVPGCVHILHECWITFESSWIPDLLDGHIATSADNVAEINEVVSFSGR